MGCAQSVQPGALSAPAPPAGQDEKPVATNITSVEPIHNSMEKDKKVIDEFSTYEVRGLFPPAPP